MLKTSLTTLCGAVLAAALPIAASAAMIHQVSDDGGASWITVAPLATAQNSRQFYAWGAGTAHLPFDTTPDGLSLFIHEDTGATGAARHALGLVVNGPGGGAGMLSFTLSGAPDAAVGGAEDEWDEIFGWDDPAGGADGDFAFSWGPDYTDGFTMEGLGGDAWTILIEDVAQTGLAAFEVLSGDPADPLRLALGGLEGLLIRSVPAEAASTQAATSAIPLPAAAPLLAGALAALGMAARRRRAA